MAASSRSRPASPISHSHMVSGVQPIPDSSLATLSSRRAFPCNFSRQKSVRVCGSFAFLQLGC